MATTRQKEAARRNIARAREVQSERAHGADIPRQSEGLSTKAAKHFNIEMSESDWREEFHRSKTAQQQPRAPKR